MDFDARYAAHYINDAVEDVITTVIHPYKAKIIQKLRKCFFFVVKFLLFEDYKYDLHSVQLYPVAACSQPY